MIKIIDQDLNELGPLLSSKHIPHKGELLLQDDKYYQIIEIIHDDDEGDTLIFVRFLGIKNSDVHSFVNFNRGVSVENEYNMVVAILKKVMREKRLKKKF